jgi:putative endonuclease
MEQRPTRRRSRGVKQSTRARGRYGEAAAEAYLRKHGYRILARNLHLRYAEIDLLALERETLCFVEVRLRTSNRFGTAAESIDARKRQRLVRAATSVMAQSELPPYRAVRFDVVCVRPGSPQPCVHLIRDAFRPGEAP